MHLFRAELIGCGKSYGSHRDTIGHFINLIKKHREVGRLEEFSESLVMDEGNILSIVLLFMMNVCDESTCYFFELIATKVQV